MDAAQTQFYMMLAATVVGGTASVATCGFVIYMFKRVYASHDKLAKAVDELAQTVSNFKLQVSGDYVGVATCRECRAKCDEWKSRVDKELDQIRADTGSERLKLGERMTRMETKMAIHCPKKGQSRDTD